MKSIRKLQAILLLTVVVVLAFPVASHATHLAAIHKPVSHSNQGGTGG